MGYKKESFMKICQFKDDNSTFEDTSYVFGLNEHVMAEYNDQTITESIENLKKSKERFGYLVEHFDTLDDKEFLKHFKYFYNWDFHKLLACCILKEKDTKQAIVKTDDYVSVQVSEGSGRDFGYWNEWHRAAYRIAYDSSLEIEKRVYKIQELSDLCKQGKIAVLERGIAYGKEVSSEKAYPIHCKLADIKLNNYRLHYGFSLKAGYISEGVLNQMYSENALAFKAIRADVTKEEMQKNYESLCTEADKKIKFLSKTLEKRFCKTKEKKQNKSDEMCK